MNKNTLVKILTTGLYIAPLSIYLFVQKTLYPMVTLKFISLFIVIELLFLVWLSLILWYPEFRLSVGKLGKSRSLVFTSSLLLLVVLTISSLMATNPVRSVWSTPDRMTGLFALWHFFALFIMLYSLRRHINWEKYIRFVFLISLIVALFVLVQKVAPGFFLSGEASRPGSFLGNPAMLAGYLIFNVFLGGWLALTSTGKTRMFFALASLYEVIAIFLGSTRGAMLGLLVGAVFLMIMLAWPKLRNFSWSQSVFKNPSAIILIIVLLFSAIFMGTRSSPFWQRVPGLNRLAVISVEESAVNNRLLVWQIAYDSFKEKPILGHGWENFRYSFDSHYNPKLFRSGLGETFWDRPHNVFLEYLTNAGLLGFLAYLGLFASAFYVTIKKSTPQFKPFGIALLSAYLIQNIFVFDSFGTYLMLFILLAYLASQEHVTENETQIDEVAPRDSVRLFKYGMMAIFSAGILVLLGINVKVVYANNLEYWGINYITQKMPVEGVASFRRALAIGQPYVNDVRKKFLQMIVKAYPIMEIPNFKENVLFAFSELKKITVTDPFDYYAYYTEADAKIVLRQVSVQYYKDAEIAIKKADMLSPNRQQNLYVYAKVKLLFGDTVGAVKMLERGVNLDPESADPHYYYALMLWNTGTKGKAIEEYRRAVDLGYKPKDATEGKQLGDLYGDAGEYEKALEFYQRAIFFDPSDVDANLKAGLVYIFMEKPDLGKPYLTKVLELLPDFKTSENYKQFQPYYEALGL